MKNTEIDIAIPGAARLGIIAGYGRFPFLVAEGARSAGCELTVVALRGLADGGLRHYANRFYWAGIARVGRWVRLLRRNGAQSVILAGAVKKSEMFSPWRLLRYVPDWTAARIWFFQLADRRNDTVLAALADEFARHGIIMQDCTQYAKEHLAPEGVLTKRKPGDVLLADAEFGWRIAKELGRLDIGQAVAVKEREVIAVEAIEGTDRMIERAGKLCPRGGWTLVKTAKPNQDMRFDVPTIGPDTITNLVKHHATMLVIEAGKTVIIDRGETVAAADRAGLIILSRA